MKISEEMDAVDFRSILDGFYRSDGDVESIAFLGWYSCERAEKGVARRQIICRGWSRVG